MMKIALIIGTALMMAHGLPSSGKGKKPKLMDVSRESSEELPEGARLPDDSVFVDKTETVEGALVYGQYSYIDPLGSLVVVKYTVGKDGTGYTERRLLTVNYKSDEPISQIPGEKDIETDEKFNEEELIKKIISRLEPQIREMVAHQKDDDSCNASTLLLTPTSLSIWDYLYNKIGKIEAIFSQILCEMMTANSEEQVQKTEDELLSNIIFKLTSLIPDGTVSEYAKKMGRHLILARGPKVHHERHGDNEKDEETTESMALSEELEETTVANVDLENLLGNLFVEALSDDDTTSNVSDNLTLEKILNALLTVFFSEHTDLDSNPVSEFFKVLAGDEQSPLAIFGELLVDVESLLSLYAREAVCLNFPRKSDSEVLQEETTNVSDLLIMENMGLKVQSLVKEFVTSYESQNPLEDEELIQKILSKLEKDYKVDQRPLVVNEIHKRRLNLYVSEIEKHNN